MTDERYAEIKGILRSDNLDAGSKSARRAITLVTEDGSTYSVRLRDEPSFGPSALEDILGSVVTARGLVSDKTFIIQEFTVQK